MLESQAATVLVVDDDPVSRYPTVRFLQKAGFRVLQADTGAEGLRLAAQHPDLIVLDINLPDINGFQVVHALKQAPLTASIPILHLSALFSKSEDKALGLEGGADGYLTHPVNPHELIATVRALLRARKAEEAARLAARDWQTTFDAIPDAVCLLDADSQLRRCNQAFQELLGKSCEQLENRELGDAAGELLTQSPFDLTTLPEPQEHRSGEMALGQRWFRISQVPLVDDADAVTGSVLVLNDITERKQVEDQLRKSQTLLAQAQHLAKLASWEWDLSSQRVSWSEGLEQLLGYPQRDSRPSAKRVLKALGLGPRRTLARLIRQCLQSGAPFSQRFRLVGADQTERVVCIQGCRMQNHRAQSMRLIGTVQDVTEQAQNEEQRVRIEQRLQQAHKLESLGVLAGGVAHDFNNLLVGVLGNAELALMTLGPESPAAELLEGIKTSGLRASELSHQMLAYSGRGRFIVQLLNLSRAVRDMLPLLQASLGPGADLELDLDPHAPLIEADLNQLRQVLLNLLTNASEALQEQKGLITLRVREVLVDHEYLSQAYDSGQMRDGSYVMLEVTDTGCGFDPETKKRIFDPFFSTKFTGRGLGLAVVLGVVRSHKGLVRVESTPGQGTRFQVLFPRPTSAAAFLSLPAARPAAPEPPGQGLVLVVDDEEIVRSVSKVFLEQAGYQVLTAVDGLQGLELMREHRAEVRAVILDLTMPVMNGEQAYREMRQLRADLPVLLMSGFSEQEATEHFGGLGLAGFLAKPFSRATLTSKLGQILAAPQPSAQHSVLSL